MPYFIFLMHLIWAKVWENFNKIWGNYLTFKISSAVMKRRFGVFRESKTENSCRKFLKYGKNKSPLKIPIFYSAIFSLFEKNFVSFKKFRYYF